jgi:cell division transport system permease protein
MIMKFPYKFSGKRERTLGKARGKRRYDLPLSNNDSTRFLVTLIGLMTFLAVLAIATFFALDALSTRWTSGLEDKATIEIPAQTAEGLLLTADELSQKAQTAASVLENHPAIKAYHVMTADEIQELVKPWLGEGTADTGQMPLPGLISVEIKPDTPRDVVMALGEKIALAAPGARLDSHETWLKDVLRFTGALKFAATLLILVIGLTTMIAVAGAVRARLAIHRADVELLHLMGAADRYISGQFQRHSLLLGLTGAAAGVLSGVIALGLIGWASGEMDVNLLPEYSVGIAQVIVTIMLPLVIAGLATMTARQTVMRELSGMP